MGDPMTEINTIPGLLKANYEKWGDNEVAIRDKDFGLWQEYTWKDSYEKVKYFCLGLTSLGFEPEDKVAVIGDNEPEWYWAAFATQAGRGMVVPQFTDAIPEELKSGGQNPGYQRRPAQGRKGDILVL